MNTRKLAALMLIVAGALALAYGGFSYTKTTHQADVGTLHLSTFRAVCRLARLCSQDQRSPATYGSKERRELP